MLPQKSAFLASGFLALVGSASSPASGTQETRATVSRTCPGKVEVEAVAVGLQQTLKVCRIGGFIAG